MMTRSFISVLTLGVALAWLPGTVHAQARQRYPGTYSSAQVAYDQGYREGTTAGEQDGRSGRAFNYERYSAYRDPRGGYGGYGSGDQWRNDFRRGFAEGYRAGYDRYARGGYGTYGRSYPTYPGSSYPGGYGYPSRPGYSGSGYYNNYGYDRGFQDGYNKGREAARDNDRYDPYREKDYRKGDKGYNKRYGTRGEYERTYRDGFLSGYERGYRENQYSGSRRGWPW